jgi:hypothetical protein
LSVEDFKASAEFVMRLKVGMFFGAATNSNKVAKTV